MSSIKDPFFDGLREHYRISSEIPNDDIWYNIMSKINQPQIKKNIYLQVIFLLLFIFIPLNSRKNHRIPSENITKKTAKYNSEFLVYNQQIKTLSKKDSYYKNGIRGRIREDKTKDQNKHSNTESNLSNLQRTEIKISQDESISLKSIIQNSFIHTKSFSPSYQCNAPLLDLEFTSNLKLLKCVSIEDKLLLTRRKEESKGRSNHNRFDVFVTSKIAKAQTYGVSLKQNLYSAESNFSWINSLGLGASYVIHKNFQVQTGLEIVNQYLNYQINQQNVVLDTISGKLSLETPLYQLNLYQSNLVNPQSDHEDEEINLEVEDTIVPSLDFLNRNQLSYFNIPITFKYDFTLKNLRFFLESGIVLASLHKNYTEVEIQGFVSPRFQQINNLKKHYLSSSLALGLIYNINSKFYLQTGINYQGSISSFASVAHPVIKYHSVGLTIGVHHTF